MSKNIQGDTIFSCLHIFEAFLIEECFSWFGLGAMVQTKANLIAKASKYISDNSVLPTLWQWFGEGLSCLDMTMSHSTNSSPKKSFSEKN